MKTRYIVATCVAALITGAGIGHLLMPTDLATGAPASRLTDADLPPYCMVDRDTADLGYLTVAGPAGGAITVDDRDAGTLVLVLDDGEYGSEVAPDAGPYSGILYNVMAGDDVRVDGKVCEPT